MGAGRSTLGQGDESLLIDMNTTVADAGGRLPLASP
jgi:hypothetical protein